MAPAHRPANLNKERNIALPIGTADKQFFVRILFVGTFDCFEMILEHRDVTAAIFLPFLRVKINIGKYRTENFIILKLLQI